jgi:hypothetical protein
MCLTIFHGSLLHATQDLEEHFADKHISHVHVLHQEEHITFPDEHHPHHNVAGLDCRAHGGPNDPIAAQEMVYWEDLPLDSEFVSPLHSNQERRYLTFEPDGGGWNNIRMSMETVLVMAIATGRVLVLPPSQKMYLLGTQSICFADFFPLEAIAKEHAGLEILSMEEFLKETYGKVHNLQTNEISYPPNNQTDWNGDSGIKHVLSPWLQSVANNPDWNPSNCLAGEYRVCCLES